jgi:hypothetical protein
MIEWLYAKKSLPAAIKAHPPASIVDNNQS